jgi:hypothetical protein
MIELFPGFLIAVLACLGAGYPILLAILRNTTSRDPLNDFAPALLVGLSGLIGIAFFAWLSGLIGIFIPVANIVPWLLGVCALAGLAVFFQMTGRRGSVFLCISGLMLFALTFSAREVLHGDTANYHHQAVLWMSGWQLPLGLANLHGRFGFNSSWWAFSALFEFPWSEKGCSIYYPIGLLCFFFGCLMLAALWNAWSGKFAVSDVILFAAFYLWIRQTTGINNPSFSTDAPANLLIVASGWGFAKWRERGLSVWFWVWCLLAATAASFKLTALPWLAASALAAGGLIIWDGSNVRQKFTTYLLPITIGLMILFTYAGRGILISGFPFYPTKLFGQSSLPWAVPENTISGDTDGIRDWPTRGEAGGIFEFAWNWVQNQFGLTNLLFGLLFAAGLILALGLLAHRIGTKKIADAFIRYIPLLGASAVGFALCFAYAPALRFVSGYFFLFIGTLLGIAIVSASPGRAFLRSIIVIMILGSTVLNLRGALERKVQVLRKPPLPLPVVETFTTKEGEQIQVNRTGFSWAVTPPSTPYFNENLKILRDASGVIRRFESPSSSTVD